MCFGASWIVKHAPLETRDQSIWPILPAQHFNTLIVLPHTISTLKMATLNDLAPELFLSICQEVGIAVTVEEDRMLTSIALHPRTFVATTAKPQSRLPEISSERIKSAISACRHRSHGRKRREMRCVSGLFTVQCSCQISHRKYSRPCPKIRMAWKSQRSTKRIHWPVASVVTIAPD